MVVDEVRAGSAAPGAYAQGLGERIIATHGSLMWRYEQWHSYAIFPPTAVGRACAHPSRPCQRSRPVSPVHATVPGATGLLPAGDSPQEPTPATGGHAQVALMWGLWSFLFAELSSQLVRPRARGRRSCCARHAALVSQWSYCATGMLCEQHAVIE